MKLHFVFADVQDTYELNMRVPTVKACWPCRYFDGVCIPIPESSSSRGASSYLAACQVPEGGMSYEARYKTLSRLIVSYGYPRWDMQAKRNGKEGPRGVSIRTYHPDGTTWRAR